jgi:hypothetical protein
MTAAGSGFFAIDRRAWERVCGRGINTAVAYLVQARGTGRDNRTTSWSTQAVETHTGIGRIRAKVAIRDLLQSGFSRLIVEGTRPRYELSPWGDLPGNDPRPPLSYGEVDVVDKVRRGRPIRQSYMKDARRAARAGWLVELESGGFALAPTTNVEPDWIWLPNEVVTGAAGEIPPLELVRQTQDPMTLRLLIDMYHAQNLREDGGVSRRVMWRKYERVMVGERAQLIVWGFNRSNDWARWDELLTAPHRREELTEEEKATGKNKGVDFFRRTAQLSDLGLIEWVAHLVESDDESGEIIHPLNTGGSNSIEDRLGRGAHEAGRALIADGQYDWALNQGVEFLVPVPRHIANVQVVGIARLRYRPHTRMTAGWWADLNANAEKHLARYVQLAQQNTRAVL